MKTFNDLIFIKHANGDGVRAAEIFDNGYGVSVIKTKYSYGGAYGYYELAVIDSHENIVYGNPITSDDIIGWLLPGHVTEIMQQLQEYVPQNC